MQQLSPSIPPDSLVIPPAEPAGTMDLHLIERIRPRWDRFVPHDDENRAPLYEYGDGLGAIHARLAALPPEPLSLRDIHQKWRALEDRKQVLWLLEDLLGVIGRRRSPEKAIAELVADGLGHCLVEAELEQTEAAVENALDEIWEFDIQGVEELCVFLDIAMGKHEIEVAEPSNPKIADHVPYLAHIGRVVRGMRALAPGFEFPSFKPMFTNQNTAERLLAGESKGERTLSPHAAE